MESPSAAAPMPQGGVVAADSLSPVSVLLSRTWERFRLQWMSLVLVGVLAGVGSAVGTAVAALVFLLIGRFSFWAWLTGVLGLLSWYLWILTWAQAAAMVLALDGSGKVDFLSAYRATYGRIAALSWVGALAVLIALGGYCFFIVPGVGLTVFLFCAPFSCLVEGTAGLESLIRSWGYVNGRWFAVGGRLLLLAVLPWIGGRVPFFGGILRTAAVLFALVATCILYEELRGKTRPPQADGDKAKLWIWAGLLGFIAWGLAAWRVSAVIRDAVPFMFQAYAGRLGLTGTVSHP